MTNSTWVASTPTAIGVRGGSFNDTAISSASVTPAGESSFTLSFSLDRPGVVNFLVLYSSMMARFVNTYVAFDNDPGDPAALISSDLAAFSDGVVARGSCAVMHAGVLATCSIGPQAAGDAPSTYSCSDPTTSCQVQNTCFGPLCDYSQYGIVPNSTYKVRRREIRLRAALQHPLALSRLSICLHFISPLHWVLTHVHICEHTRTCTCTCTCI